MLRIFQHYIPASIVWLIAVEFVVLFLSVYVGIEIRFFDAPSDKALLEPISSKALVFSFVMWFSMTALGLHTRNVVDDFASMMIRIGLSFAAGFVVSTLLYYIYPNWFLGRGVFGFALLSAFFGILITRTIYQKIDNNQIFKRRVLILGAGDKAAILNEHHKKARRQGQEIVGYVNISSSEPVIDQEKLLKIETTLLDLALENDIDEIVLAMDDRRQGFPISGLLECKMKGIFVRDAVHFLEGITGHIELDVLHPSVMIFSSGFTRAVSPGSGKRFFDVLASLTLLILASPWSQK